MIIYGKLNRSSIKIVTKRETQLCWQIFCTTLNCINNVILLNEKFLQFDWFGAVVFQLNLKSLHVKITNLLWGVV